MNWLILAQRIRVQEDKYQAVRHGFTDLDPNMVRDVGLAVVVVIALLGLAALVQRAQRRALASGELSPMRLFWRVQGKLGLSLTERLRLWHLAKALQVAHPTSLLISLSLYEEAAKRYCQTRGWFGPRAGARGPLQMLQARLFREPSDPAPAPASA